jgi:Uma2 family endonuclease
MDRPSEMQPARAEPIRLTHSDYLAFPDDGRRHELIDGEHVVTPAPLERHQRVSRRLLVAIDRHVDANGLGEVFHAPFDVILSDHDVVEPDLLFVSSERRAIVHGWVYGAPDLVIEILSAGSRRVDRGTKLHLYDRFGVREYWLVDPDANTVAVHRRAPDGAFPRLVELSAENGDTLTTPLLAGFSLALRDVFA